MKEKQDDIDIKELDELEEYYDKKEYEKYIIPPKELKQHEKNLKVPTFLELNGAFMTVDSAFNGIKGIEQVMNSDIYETVTNSDRCANDENLYDRAFDPNADGTKNHIDIVGQELPTLKIYNQEAYEEYKKALNDAADYIDNHINQNIQIKDAYDKKASDLIRLYSSERLRGQAKGRTDYYETFKTPLGNSRAAIQACIETRLETQKNPGVKKLKDKIKKWEKRFPIYDVLSQTSKVLNSLDDYYDAKDANNGVMTPEQEAEIRQKIYNQIVPLTYNYNKCIAAIEKQSVVNELLNDFVIAQGNDPFHIHPLSARGTSNMHCSLDAYKNGLEQGWHLDDIPILAAFYQVGLDLHRDTVCNRALKLEDLKIYNPPKYNSYEQEQYINKIYNYYKKITSTPLKDAKQRKEILDNIYEIIDDGIKKGYLTEKHDNEIDVKATVKFFLYTKSNMVQREMEIEKGLASAVPAPAKPLVAESKAEKVEQMMALLNSPRTDLKFGSENDEHKNLRLATEELHKFLKENPRPAEKEKLEEYSIKYLSKLDAVMHYSKVYQNKRMGASSSGGKKRLAGAVELGEFVETERKAMLRNLSANDLVQKDHTIDQFRTSYATKKFMDAYNEIANMNEMPKDKEGKKKLVDLATDILVGRLASSKGTPGVKTFNSMGYEMMKREVLKSPEFGTMMKGYLKDDNLTPAQLAENLAGNDAIAKMQNGKSFEKSLKNVEQVEEFDRYKKNLEVEANKVVAAKQAASQERLAKNQAKLKKKAVQKKSGGNNKTKTEPKPAKGMN